MTTTLADDRRHIPYHSKDQNDGSILAVPPASGEQATFDEGPIGTELNDDRGRQDDVITEAALAKKDSPTVGFDADRHEEQVKCDDGIDGPIGGGEAGAEITSVPRAHVQESETILGAEGSDEKADSGVVNDSAHEESAKSLTEPFNPQAHTLSDTMLRPHTPASRNSTPPLIALAKKSSSVKFSSINVTKEFLRKQAIPSSGTSFSTTKSGSLNGQAALKRSYMLINTCGQSAASPVPIPSASSRLLSAKLITVPISKSSTSPHPPSSTSAQGPAASSPWAKPSIPVTSEVPKDPQILHQPAPKHGRTLASTVSTVMGSGQGIGAAAASKPAWRQVQAEGKRAVLGISREFPTTNEIAEGRRYAM